VATNEVLWPSTFLDVTLSSWGFGKVLCWHDPAFSEASKEKHRRFFVFVFVLVGLGFELMA
jgi:hypothetical protein